MLAQKRLVEVYSHWLSSPDNEMTIRKELGVPPNIKIQQEHCTVYLNILYEKSKSDLNSAFNLNSRIKIQRIMQNGKSRYALIPESGGIFSDIFDFMDEDKELTDIWFDENALVTRQFLLENNVTEDEWVERAEIYVEMLEFPHDVLSMNIIDQKIILEIDPNLNDLIEEDLFDESNKIDIIELDVEKSLEKPEEKEVSEMNFTKEDGCKELDLGLSFDDSEESSKERPGQGTGEYS